jgi:hypothetical protein
VRGHRVVTAVEPETRVWLLRGKAQPQIWRHPISFAAERRAASSALPIIVSPERPAVNLFERRRRTTDYVVRETG